MPEVLGEEVSQWARPAVPFAGAKHGFVALPEVGDGVWIEFEAGNVTQPIWSGFWWGDDEIPDPGAEKTRVFATSNGHKLVLDEDANEVRIEHGGGPSIVLTDSDITIAVGVEEDRDLVEQRERQRRCPGGHVMPGKVLTTGSTGPVPARWAGDAHARPTRRSRRWPARCCSRATSTRSPAARS